MPRYYLNLHNRIGFIRDEEGHDLPDLEAATQLARESIRSIISEEIKEGVIDLRGKIDIADERGQVLSQLPFRDAVEVHMGEESI
jgi:hypothetical protein